MTGSPSVSGRVGLAKSQRFVSKWFSQRPLLAGEKSRLAVGRKSRRGFDRHITLRRGWFNARSFGFRLAGFPATDKAGGQDHPKREQREHHIMAPASFGLFFDVTSLHSFPSLINHCSPSFHEPICAGTDGSAIGRITRRGGSICSVRRLGDSPSKRWTSPAGCQADQAPPATR